MTSTKQNDFIALRKAQLLSEISFATTHNDQHLSALQALCVHRYGLGALNELGISGKGLVLNKSSETSAENEVILDKTVFEDASESISAEHLISPLKVEVSSDAITNTVSVDQNKVVLEQLASDDSHHCHLQEEVLDNSKDQAGGLLVNSCNEDAPAPPPPSISHLRRWLTSFESEDLKAS